MKSCFFYLKSSDTPLNPQEVRKSITDGSVDEKVKTLKEFIRCLVNDDTYPPMIMVIITNVIPLVSKHPELKKVLLLYWEVIQKSKSPNDPTLKDEMFLACNSLRSDLLSHNQYVRGRTLRLVSRIMHRGVIEPLSSAITENITHKSAYVRRNTVVCLYNVFMNFGSDIIGEIDEDIEELLKKETDLSTKRNAFILLNKSNPQKAMQFLDQQIKSQSLEDLGDILQLAVLKVLKQKAREEPNNRAKFLKTISAFTFKASESVLLQCSITSLAISNSVLSIKTALSSYVNILSRTNELNVKKIVLDKLEIACKNSNYIQESLVEDLIKNLKTPSYEIKIKILNIVTMNLNPKISESLLKELKLQITDCDDKDYLYRIIKTVQNMAFKFNGLHSEIINFIFSKIARIHLMGIASAQTLGNTIRVILEKSEKQKSQNHKKALVESFKFIESKEVIKEVLKIYGNNFNDKAEIQLVIDGLKTAIGSLPITIQNDKKDLQKREVSKPKAQFKTKILEDGSYQTQKIEDHEQIEEVQENTFFRKIIAEDSIIGGVFTRSIGKMLYKIRKSQNFNKSACSIILILCSLLRNYQNNIFQVDQATIDQISTLIRKIINPSVFINGTDPVYENRKQSPLELSKESQSQSHILQKNPSDLIFFRQLKKGTEGQGEFDDEQVNQILSEQKEKQSFVDKLKSMVQLTGHFDALYAQSFVTVSKTDVFFEILLVNTTKSNMLNVQIEFASTAQILVLQKAQSVNLRPFESVSLRTQIRFVTGEFGSIYGYINYDNQAGIEQPYLITEQIKVNFIQFIVPAKISQNQFKLKWTDYITNQLKHEIAIKNNSDETGESKEITYDKIYKIIENELHCLRVQESTTQGNTEEGQQEEYFLSKSFYGKSKLGEDFLLIATIFKDKDVDISFNIRSKEAVISNMIMKKTKEIGFDEIGDVVRKEE